jgi:outer membrane protein TolC
MSLPTNPAGLALALTIALALAPAPSAAFCEAADAIAAARSLSVDEAVAAGLAADPGLRAAAMDAKAAGLRATDAKLRMLPSLALSAGYTKLSEEPTFSLDVPNPPSSTDPDVLRSERWIGGILQSLGSAFDTSITDSKDIRVDLQYPVFAGFRLREAAEIARLQSLGKGEAEEIARRALTFEIRRAYWESTRAQANVETLGKALELEQVLREEVSGLSAQGMASEAERLGEEAKVDQAEMALDEAGALRDQDFLVLSALVGDSSASSVETVVYELASAPGARGLPAALEPYAAAFSSSGTESGAALRELVEAALARRPELRAADIALEASQAALKAARAELYPTLTLAGALSYADPDPRIFPPQDEFNLSWSVGARLRYDVGALPGAIERGKAAQADIDKARADLERQRDAAALDVRKCALALKRAFDSLRLTKDMVAQADESLRAARSRFDNGLARRSELLQAETARLRAGLAVDYKAVDLEIAQADLLRAAALE